MAGDHVGVPLDDHGGLAVDDRLLGLVDAVERGGLVEQRSLGLFEYFASAVGSSSVPPPGVRPPKAIGRPMASKIGKIRASAQPVVAALGVGGWGLGLGGFRLRAPAALSDKPASRNPRRA
ncbi:MAG: hypothetical protein U5O39_17770, partial [Gammaproteobacteria bacterium]|nr:hypothetical protein [Gammaproteobacteria bacterium]